MENPNEDQSFNYAKFFRIYTENNPDILFNNSVANLSSKAWFKRIIPNEIFPNLPHQSLFSVASDRQWEKLLPFPETRPLSSLDGSFSQSEARWMREKRIWSIKATTWLRETCTQINCKVYQLKNHIKRGVALLNKEYNIELIEKDVLQNWFTTIENLPLTQFLELDFSSSNIGAFMAQEATKLRQELIPDLPSINATEFQSGLTVQQVALLYAYRGKKIQNDERADNTAQLYGHTSGHKLYQLYVKVNSPAQRTGIDEKSIKKMVKDIERILPFLNSPFLEQAEEERHTLQLRK